MARRLDSEIKVMENGDWIFRGSPIEQKDILEYFRKNLKESEDGVFIDNHFGEFSENGYLEIFGYPLNLIRVREEEGELYFLSDAGEEIPLDFLDLEADKEGELYAKKKNHKLLKYKLARNVATSLSEFIQDSPAGMRLKTSQHEFLIPETNRGPEVSLPVEFRNPSSRFDSE
ncbi:hypothetical protein EHQ27_01970 [Leptospira wolffii]|uniref:DUF1285 domain-containing protein n=1 Tax=Leptospira wolffii TaxID=409998 RepID=A0A2M9ZB90_9LEPT|nr:hypothetical protein [Leptospira wolffii]PJZ65678.1 hypothetical protein CH371_12175 [Leptospira wolffii]TGK56108.1 hypothetical protein EHQ32_16990 [Leptospira wolffii]TGK72154.1 hypothetical protein EHQ35_12425 [Leptospira wolffii]TGK77458.1 hypothetical protein EHQ27_01970 [Leptospira wolffii]TGL27731.1 hypothetical protein EHQ57_15250 [Leptospira wolffii]